MLIYLANFEIDLGEVIWVIVLAVAVTMVYLWARRLWIRLGRYLPEAEDEIDAREAERSRRSEARRQAARDLLAKRAHGGN